MIAPDVEVLGVDPTGYAWLCDAIAARQPARSGWFWGLHDGAEIQRIATDLPVDASPAIDLADPAGAAQALQQILRAERVVLIDQRHRATLARDLEAAADPGMSQWEYFRESQRRFWSSAAVATSPEAPADRWEAVAEALRQAGDIDVVLLVVNDGNLFLGLRGAIREGRLVRLGPALPEGIATPTDIRDLVASVDSVAYADVVLVCTRASLGDALERDDVIAALTELALSPQVLFARGLDRLGDLLVLAASPR